jgi:hypothetical protein
VGFAGEIDRLPVFERAKYFLMRDAMETPTKQTLSYRPIPAPRPSLRERINWRVVIFAMVTVIPIGALFYVWLNETVTGGIHDYGGYKQVDLKAMSTFDMDQSNATMENVPEKWRGLEGQKVLLIGEMWDPQNAGDGKMSYFQLVYSKTKCCFSGPPLAQHFVDGNVQTGVSAQYYEGLVKVWGKIHVFMRHDPETGIIKSVYHVDVEKLEPLEG